ncbi:SOS response-associated peptidase family protein [Jeongeupia wiesaeckerbachi]|uniref:SOS response-associated peptidase family protein n=1 Tax=Jeongeupia wiesaeckerbachi TaxID=3051218 RepID=UPI003D8072B7
MCGRLVRASRRYQYAYGLGWIDESDFDPQGSTPYHLGDMPSHYNTAPSMPLYVANSFEGKLRSIDNVMWGYRPAWAEGKTDSRGKALPIVINARRETVANNPYYRSLWQHRRRVIVPVDGWHEWVMLDAKHKQPYYITSRDRAPLYNAQPRPPRKRVRMAAS